MTEYGGRRRGQAERDTITVEIGYALCSGAFAAAVLLGAVAGPAWLFELPGPVETLLLRAGSVLAAVVFTARVIGVLWRHGRAAAPPVARDPDQPSHPGRTSPDS
ncbi:DUF6332 family protein [Streptomyces sp. NPDC006610]|jgi:hypothetical protein|uniref:DUF6332 family protein n=1 Tax=Streptomyces sp. NPDC006610 TaxID=3154584 RepID=UPI0033A42726